MRNTIIFLLALLSAPTTVLASTLQFVPDGGELGPGNEIALTIQIEADRCVNAIEADIGFTNDYLVLKDFLVHDSILALWIEKPDKADIAKANEAGILNFIGGVPGGYCGKIPGDPGNSNTIASLLFEVPSDLGIEERTRLVVNFLPSTKVLLNDGLGTSDDLILKTAGFNYVSMPVDIKDTWSSRTTEDTIAPEPFIVQLRQNPNIFNGQYHIIFNTNDKQSGIDRYEVLEIRHDEELGVVRKLSLLDRIMGKKIQVPTWKVAQIPYLLEDQELGSTIRVKAVDKAGNERFVEYIPPESKQKSVEKSRFLNSIILYSILAVFLAILILSFLFVKKIILNKKYDKEQDL